MNAKFRIKSFLKVKMSSKSYFNLAKEAIVALKDRSGSSVPAIKKWILAKYPTLVFAQV